MSLTPEHTVRRTTIATIRAKLLGLFSLDDEPITLHATGPRKSAISSLDGSHRIRAVKLSIVNNDDDTGTLARLTTFRRYMRRFNQYQPDEHGEMWVLDRHEDPRGVMRHWDGLIEYTIIVKREPLVRDPAI
jgi:hypothetical protein